MIGVDVRWSSPYPRDLFVQAMSSCATSGSILAEASVLSLTPPSKIGTGICFLDHMVDQFTSHGQLGVTLRCGVVGSDGPPAEPRSAKDCFAPLRDYATGASSRPHDQDIFIACGTALGLALKRVVDDAVAAAYAAGAKPHDERGRGAAVFCSPLDESFTEASLDLLPAQPRCDTALEPYGTFCAGSAAGRAWVGRYRTALTPLFWGALASALGCELRLRKVRGGNAHHQLESCFKAFARVFRAALDRIADGGEHGCASPGAPPPAVVPPPANDASRAVRRAERRRATKETTIEVVVDLDAPWAAEDPPSGGAAAWTGQAMTATQLRATTEAAARIATGIGILDEVLGAFARGAGVKLVVRCEGDRHIDDHHTAEDVAITLGQCLHEALGDKAGCARMGCAEGQSGGGGGGGGGARVRAVLDLSNRPHFESDLPFDEEYVGGVAAGGDGVDGVDGVGIGGGAQQQQQEGAGGEGAAPPAPWDGLCGAVLSSEMLFHVLNSLTLEMRATCHLELRADAGGVGHTRALALAAAAAYGAALARAIRIDPRRRGAVASSKGTLSK